MFETLSQLTAEWLVPGILIWLVLCLLTTNIVELLTKNLRRRSRLLEAALENMFGSEELTQKFYNHVLLQTTIGQRHGRENNGHKRDQKPDYIAPRLFSQILLEWVLSPDQSIVTNKQSMTPRQLRVNLQTLHMKYPQFTEAIEVWLIGEGLTKSEEPFSAFLANLETWFNAAMEETTRQYKRYTQRLAFILGMIVALFLNFDPIAITYQLWEASHPPQSTTGNTENSQKAAIPPGGAVSNDREANCP